jgi:hypothetical protein
MASTLGGDLCLDILVWTKIGLPFSNSDDNDFETAQYLLAVFRLLCLYDFLTGLY